MRLTWAQAVEEALCFGWIDSQSQRIDDDAVRQRWTPRKPSSTWSDVNIRLVAKLVEEGRMTPAGLAAYERRKPDRQRHLQLRAGAGARARAGVRAPAARRPGRLRLLRRRDPVLPQGLRQLGHDGQAGSTREKRLAQLIDDSAHGRLVPPLRYGTPPAWLARAAQAAAEAS